jgi:enoyl-[acyl-carrier protein] reductase II
MLTNITTAFKLLKMRICRLIEKEVLVMKKNRVCDLLGIEYPVIQAPMTPICPPELVAAVSDAGGLGVLGPINVSSKRTSAVGLDALDTSERLRMDIRECKSLTNRPFGVNFITNPPEFASAYEFSDACVSIALEEGISIAVLIGPEPERYTKRLKDAGVKVVHRSSPINTEEARKAEDVGVDILVAVGFEGGGHTGADGIPTFVLVPQIVDAVSIPVIAGGGIVDGRGLAAALALGAEGVYMGTRFIASTECPAHDRVKQAILDSIDTSTVTWKSILGITRALRNPLAQRCVEMEAKGASVWDIFVEYSGGFMKIPEGDMENGCISFGAGAGIIKEIKNAGDIVREIVEDADKVINRLQ